MDFVLYGSKRILAFEVKRSSRYSQRDLTGLRSFRSDYPMAKCFFLYGGDQDRYEDGIHIMPLKQALVDLPSILDC